MTDARAGARGGAAGGLARRTVELLAGLTGWRRLMVAAALGALAAGAFPPTYLLPLLVVAFTGWLWLLEGARRPRTAFWIGWAFGFGHFLIGLYWVGLSFLVDAAQYGALAPFAVIGLAAGLAFFMAVVAGLLQLLPFRGLSRVLALTTLWLAAEWVRSWLFGGFPWHLMGTVWSFSDAMIQLAALTGVWGLSLVTVFAAAAPATLAGAVTGGGGPGLRLWGPTVFGVALLALVWAGGAARLAAAPAVGESVVPGVTLRLVQPSIPQHLKWRRELRQGHVARQIEMSRGPGFEAITHVVWAETAVPFDLAATPELQRWLTEAIPPGGQLIAGAPRREPGPDGKLWNSLHALDSSGSIVATYDKQRLVPFGEFVPLRSILGFSKLTAGRTDFSPGPGRKSLEVGELPLVSPLICYEIIYPGDMVADSGPRPAWLLTITNDAWFGRSTGPSQHFQNGRLRAVEEGLPLVRVGNSGISGIVDPYGRVWDSMALEQVGVIDSALPAALAQRPVFASTGNLTLVFLIAAALISCLFFGRQCITVGSQR